MIQVRRSPILIEVMNLLRRAIYTPISEYLSLPSRNSGILEGERYESDALCVCMRKKLPQLRGGST